MTHRILLVLTVLCALPLAAQEGRGRADAPLGLALSDGEPVSYVLEHASYLDLTDEQRMKLIDIRRRLRSLNAPYMNQLDSLRQLMGISLEPRRRIDDDYRLQLERFDKASEPITTIVRTNNDGANLQARAVLDSLQRVKLDSIIVDERGARGRGRGRGRGSVPPTARLVPDANHRSLAAG